MAAKDAVSYVRTQIEDLLNADRIGAEIEWLTVPIGQPHMQADFDRVRRVLPGGSVLPASGTVTYEPGGQLEISTAPASSPEAICESIAVDWSFAQSALYEEDIQLVGVGYEPFRRPDRVVNSPRYDAMATYFDSGWPQGRLMMRSTAAIQVNVDLPADPAAGWRLAHALGPFLAATFANSPLAAGRPSGWQSTRLGIWQAIDPSRTAPALAGGDPAVDWAEYALDARVMFIKQNEERFEPVIAPLRFGQWIEHGHQLGYPTLNDFQTHLTTLFPPVRPKGWLEMRMIDALDDPWWRVPILILNALLHDESAASAAGKAASATLGLWDQAARDGLSHPELRACAVTCFEIARDVLTSSPSEYADVVEAFNERYVRRGRTLADETLEKWRKSGGRRVAAASRYDWAR